MESDLIRSTDRGLFCALGNFYIDPWAPVERALITHAHSDHARPGSKSYICARECEPFLRLRLGTDIQVQSVEYGEQIRSSGVSVSFHPAGHITGSSQIRVEHRGEVWVVSGDYKRELDPTCAPFEVVKCHTFISETTFGLPIYRWQKPEYISNSINTWWSTNSSEGRTSILFAYALGKSQRVMKAIDPSIGPIVAHGAVARMLIGYDQLKIALPTVTPLDDRSVKGKALVIAPPSAAHTPWLKRFAPYVTAFASGWMNIRGVRRRRGVDTGFVISDHVDWPALVQTIRETEASRILVTHGYTNQVVRWIREQGLESDVIRTEFDGELDNGSTHDEIIQPALSETRQHQQD